MCGISNLLKSGNNRRKLLISGKWSLKIPASIVIYLWSTRGCSVFTCFLIFSLMIVRLMIMSFRIDDILKKKEVPKRRDVEGEILHKALICSRDNQVWRRKDESVALKNLEEKYYLHYRNLIYGQKVYLPTYITNPYKSFNFYTHHNPQQFPLIKFTNCKRKGGQIRFSTAQTEILEKRFRAHKYLSPEERKLLAGALNLSDRQVKTWFQNRRAKWRRLHNQSVIVDENNKKETDSRNISEVSKNTSINCCQSEDAIVVK